MANRRPTWRDIVFPLVVGLISLTVVIRRPRFASIHTVDALELIAAGVMFGLGIEGFLNVDARPPQASMSYGDFATTMRYGLTQIPFRTRAYRVCGSRCEFGTRTDCTKNIDGATIATAAAARIDAAIVAAWDDAFAFTFTAARKSAALTGWAVEVFHATRDFMGASDVRATSRCRLGVGVGASHDEP